MQKYQLNCNPVPVPVELQSSTKYIIRASGKPSAVWFWKRVIILAMPSTSIIVSFCGIRKHTFALHLWQYSPFKSLPNACVDPWRERPCSERPCSSGWVMISPWGTYSSWLKNDSLSMHVNWHFLHVRSEHIGAMKLCWMDADYQCCILYIHKLWVTNLDEGDLAHFYILQSGLFSLPCICQALGTKMLVFQ